MLTAVTYIRDGDRTRIVFMFDVATAEEAQTKAKAFAPVDFRYAATCHPAAPLHIPADGDDYGREAPSIPADWITTKTLQGR